MTKEDFNQLCSTYVKATPKEEYMKDNPVLEVFEKLDGSLLLIGRIDGELITKTKTSLNSEQSVLAITLMTPEIKAFCNDMIDKGETPVFEVIGPDNVIVLRYPENALVLLGTIENMTGEVHTYEDLSILTAKKYQGKTWDSLLEDQEAGTPDKEGYVVRSNRGLCKCKRASYVALHHLKDNVNNIKSLTLLIIEDNLDDLIASFQDDPKTIEYIIKTQEKLGHRFNVLALSVEEAFDKYKRLERKEFAITCQREHKGIFGLLMSMYLGKEPSYKEFFMKNKMYEG